MADKLTHQIIDALGKAAANPAGLPLFAGKSEPGLFPATAKLAAQKCLADHLLRVVRTESSGKSPRDLYGPTEPGWEFLLAAVNPKQVLEDFVRVLEQRQGEVGELLGTARQMAESLQGLKDAVSRVLPQVSVNRIPAATPAASFDLAGEILRRLRDWSSLANAGEDCPLPELFTLLNGDSAHSNGERIRGLTPPARPDITLGEFHDCLRKLHAEGAIFLHPWTGPLYELPDPPCALLVGHGVAYYASIRQRDRLTGSHVAEPRLLEVHG